MNKIKYRAGFKYQLAKNYSLDTLISPNQEIETKYIDLSISGLLTIKAGYSWDGPSGPSVDTKNFMAGSLVHDALYQLLRMELLHEGYRLAADMLLKEICIGVGMSPFRAGYINKILQWFGSSAAHPDNVKKVYTAPAL